MRIEIFFGTVRQEVVDNVNQWLSLHFKDKPKVQYQMAYNDGELMHGALIEYDDDY